MEKFLQKCLPGGGFSGVSEPRARTMAAVKGRDNKTTERRLRLALVRSGISGWEVNPHDMLGHPDLAFRKSGLVVFVDGCFWHGCPRCGHYPYTRRRFWKAKVVRNKWRDRRNTRNLRRRGLRVLRIWEHQLATESDRAAVIAKVRQLLTSLPA